MKRDYGESDIVWEDGPFACGYVVAHNVLCQDGVRRTAHPTTDGIADTFFSIPSYVYVQGKRVYGYISVEDIATDAFLVEECVTFRAYTYRKHHGLIVKQEKVA